MAKQRNWRKFFGRYNMVLIGGIMFLIMVTVAGTGHRNLTFLPSCAAS